MPPSQARLATEALVSSGGMPSASTLSRNQAVVDAAILLQFLQMLGPLSDSWLFVWGDASSQEHVGEVFQTEFLIVSKEIAATCLQQFWDLAGLQRFDVPKDLDEGALHATQASADVELRRRAQLGHELEQALFRLPSLPQILASGLADLGSKMRALMWILWMMVGPPRLQNIIKACSSVVSVTTDMGTELGLGAFEAPSLSSLLPSWASGAAAGRDGQGLQVEDSFDLEMFAMTATVLATLLLCTGCSPAGSPCRE